MTVLGSTDAIIPAPAACRSSGTGSESVASSEFRAALSHLATAVSVIATDGPAGRAGFTCSAVCAVSDTPATVLACINRKIAAHAAIQANGVVCINCLPASHKV